MQTPTLLVALALSGSDLGALTHSQGRTEVRITSAAVSLEGLPYASLDGRLEQLGYRIEAGAPDPGTWDPDTHTVHRRAHRSGGSEHAAVPLVLRVADGVIADVQTPSGRSVRRGAHLEPLTLSESLEADRSPRRLVSLDTLPEHVWLPLLALEDARFYRHVGVDARAIARAAAANAKEGRAVEGGSTLTQQLVKNRDLSPERSLDRKVSEAARAIGLEARHSKRDILEAYLNTVYYGHVDGLAIHGIGRAAQVFFGKEARELSLEESAVLAAVVQGPNALSPIRNPSRARARRDRALDRMATLGWLTPAQAERSKAQSLGLRPQAPPRPLAPDFSRAAATWAIEALPSRSERGVGFRVETTLDPWLQSVAERAVARGIDRSPSGTQAALVAVGARDGRVLAYVGGDPDAPDRIDRARALRQPASTVKPFVLLEALDRCGDRGPLSLASRIDDGPLELDGWSPRNADGKNIGAVFLRDALTQSRNRPFVRVSEYCGRGAVAETMEEVGLNPPADVLPASLPLGTSETTPLALAGAYTVFDDGRVSIPWFVARLEAPSGRRLAGSAERRSDRIARAAPTWLVRDAMRDVVRSGTGRAARADLDVAGKTGTSSRGRDAWFAGISGDVAFVSWVGSDRSTIRGLSGGRHAAPIARDVIVHIGAETEAPAPRGVWTAWVDPKTGLRVGSGRSGAREEHFWRRTQPRRDFPILPDAPSPILAGP